MAREGRKAIPSRVTIAGHPVHPMLVPFPVAFLIGAFLTDLTFSFGADPFWAQASVWLSLAGAVSGAVAAVAGLTDFLLLPKVRAIPMAWVHFVGNAAALSLAAARTFYSWGAAEETVLPVGLVLSAVITVLLLVTGWAGGELAYRYRIGVMEEE